MLRAARAVVVAGLLLAGGSIVALGVYVRHSESDARAVLRGELGQRAGLTGQLIGGALLSSANQATLRQTFGGPVGKLPRGIRKVMNGSNLSGALVVDARGRVLAASSGDVA